MVRLRHSLFELAAVVLVVGCGRPANDAVVVTFPASAVGLEAELLRAQLDRFEQEHPGIRVELRRTPDASDQRHQLYVQWLNAQASQPDILQLDVIWVPEFAAAGWILSLDRFEPDTSDFFPATLTANRWQYELFAIPWFVDVGILYYRTDLIGSPPSTFDELTRLATEAMPATAEPHYGFLWQGAGAEGLVCVFLEHLGGFGGQIMDDEGQIVVGSERAVEALTYMRESIYRTQIVPEAALTWREERTRFGFQNGQAVFLRNWPYAFPLMQSPDGSAVAGKFAATVMPAAPSGSSTAALGGSQLAINAHTLHPAEAYEVIDFLTQREQMLERARAVGQYPARRGLYAAGELDAELAVTPAVALTIIEHATPRPVTPVYAELSGLLQVWLHRALTRQTEPREALTRAQAEMQSLLEKVGLAKSRVHPATSSGEPQ